MLWIEVTSERYDEMLGVLPPALWIAKGFLVGEASTHRKCAGLNQVSTAYAAFIAYEGKFYEGLDMTVAKFCLFKVEDALCAPSS